MEPQGDWTASLEQIGRDLILSEEPTQQIQKLVFGNVEQESTLLKIAIVGSGISGLVTAYLLSRKHDVTVFEAANYIGGHTNTITVEQDGECHAVDTGFIVYNERTYPNFIRLLQQLQVPTQPTTMSFSVRCDRTGLEYCSASLNHLFAQRLNLRRPRFYRMLLDILRFSRDATKVLEGDDNVTTIDSFLKTHRYSHDFVEHYLVPLGGAIWSCPAGHLRRFPIRFIAQFYQNHGMLNVFERPAWRVVQGGSQRYVKALTRSFADRIRLNCPVQAVTRGDDAVTVTPVGQTPERFDHVVLACHSDQALNLLTDASLAEREVLSAFPYQRNEAILHTDTSVLPRQRRAWGSWNYRIRPGASESVAITYNMNILQSLSSRRVYCVSLNEADDIDPARIIQRIAYHHPLFCARQAVAQKRHGEFLRARRTSFCGAYWGFGFHEDGVNSALAVCRTFDLTL